jgi:hypothetical protein
MGSALAAIEGTTPVPETPVNKDELIRQIAELAKSLHVRELLQVYNTTITTLGSAKDEKYFIVEVDFEGLRITVRRFKAKESEQANAVYTEMESQLPEGSANQVVLVSVDNINALKRAYPNYFLDTDLFSRLVDRVLRGDFPPPQAQTSLPLGAPLPA